MQESLARLASKSNESYKGDARGWQSPLSARPLFYAVLTYVHNECIDKCEFFYIASVNLVNQNPVHLGFCSSSSFSSYLFFSDSHLGHLSTFFFPWETVENVAQLIVLCLRVRRCLTAVGVLLPTSPAHTVVLSWDASEHHP